MASVQAFNSVMDEFISDLKETFPEEKKIKVYYNSFLTLKKANPRKVMDIFMAQATPKAALITSRDDKLFTENEDIIPDVQLSRLWNEDLDQDSKDAIWQYLNTLYVLGTTIGNIPNGLLSAIEGVAEQCASQMGENDLAQTGGMPDMGSLLAGMQNMLSNMPQQTKKEVKKPRSKSSRKKVEKLEPVEPQVETSENVEESE